VAGADAFAVGLGAGAGVGAELFQFGEQPGWAVAMRASSAVSQSCPRSRGLCALADGPDMGSPRASIPVLS
jgi:hypothetical protein